MHAAGALFTVTTSMQALIDENWSTVGVLVSAAFRLEFKHPEVLSARDKLEYRVAVFHCGERLQAAVQVGRRRCAARRSGPLFSTNRRVPQAVGDGDELRAAMQEALELKMTADRHALIRR